MKSFGAQIAIFSGASSAEIGYLIRENNDSPLFRQLVQLEVALVTESEMIGESCNYLNLLQDYINSEESEKIISPKTQPDQCIKKDISDLCSLFEYSREGGRVCPIHKKWHVLYKKLPGVIQEGYPHEWCPPSPYVLGGWYDSSDDQKRARLKTHIIYASEHNYFDEVDNYLRSLPESDWHLSK